jgi:hypothetical protein
MQRIGFAALVFALAFLACGAAMDSDVDRQIPVILDAAGSGLTTEISREGSRQTATPFLTLYNPTLQQIEDRIIRIVEKTDRSAEKEIPPEATAGNSLSRVSLAGTLPEGSGRRETNISSVPQMPEEITVRGVKGFLKGVRASRKEKPAPAVVDEIPERRLGGTDTSPR